MNLTNAQQTALKTDANGQASLTAAIAAHNWAPCVAFYNANSNPVVNVWTTSLSLTALTAAVNWKDYQALTSLLHDTYRDLTSVGFVNMADQGTARGLVGMSGQTDGVFADGTTSSVNIRAASVRTGTRLEVLLSSVGGGTLSTANVCQKDKDGNSLYGQIIDEYTFQRALGF